MTVNLENNIIAEPIDRVCHYNKLFIGSNGDVFPCCIRPAHTKIGNVSDENICELIEKHSVECRCALFNSHAPNADDEINIRILNVELSLLCQAKCAMCFADAPSWRGTYNLYDKIEKIINTYSPTTVIVQGGEILVQKESLAWIKKIKTNHPEIIFQMVTNLNVDFDYKDTIEELFETITVSFVGFQPETYKAVMGLDINKSKKLVEYLIPREKTKVRLKFLDTPASMHESHLFLDWAISLKPSKIYMHSAALPLYINSDAPFQYWNKMLSLTGKKIKDILIKHKSELSKKNHFISFNSDNIAYYEISKEFLNNNELAGCVVET